MFSSSSAYPADAFIGTVLNIFGLNINGYPLSFVIWNILLAVFAIYITQITVAAWNSQKPIAIKILLSALWLALLPNTAYLMTDARHLIASCPLDSYGKICSENAWMSLFFFAYAALGWPAFVMALRPMTKLVSERFNKRSAIIFAAITCILSAWGVLIGLLGRFNSWDIVLRPVRVLKYSLSYFSNGELFTNFIIVSIIFIILYALGEKIFISFNGKPKPRLSKNK
jgi:uncharacterized membrane protein